MPKVVGHRELILIVDDDPNVARGHSLLLQSLGYRTTIQTDPTKALDFLVQNPDIHLVLLDIRMPEMNGLDLLAKMKARKPQVGVIMATVINDIDKAVEATKKGAYNYLLKPLQEDRMKQVLDSYFANQPGSLVEDPRFSSFLTSWDPFQEIFRRVKVFAEADVPVLIQGETGTGKELISKIIHSISPRNKEPFHPVNVAALTPTIFESELFGHEKGSFTGASRDHAGLFQESGKGTLFLDEIGEIDLDQQKKLLRVLQTGQFSRIGETKRRSLNARLLFATNRDLKAEVLEGRFRKDLYYRLANYCIHLPPLRERKQDIDLLADYFFNKYNSQFGRAMNGIHAETRQILQNYHFPGNVRELEGIISGAVLIEQKPLILPESLPNHVRFPKPDKEDLNAVRYRAILDALATCQGNQTKAAKKLGIARGTLNRLLKQYREHPMAP